MARSYTSAIQSYEDANAYLGSKRSAALGRSTNTETASLSLSQHSTPPHLFFGQVLFGVDGCVLWPQ